MAAPKNRATIQPMTTETAREEAVNPLLGQLLRARAINARAERRARGGGPEHD